MFENNYKQMLKKAIETPELITGSDIYRLSLVDPLVYKIMTFAFREGWSETHMLNVLVCVLAGQLNEANEARARQMPTYVLNIKPEDWHLTAEEIKHISK